MSGRLPMLAAMVAFAAIVYLGLGLTKSKTAAPTTHPESAHGVSVPGTIYLAQAGRLYAYRGGSFRQLQTGPGSWSQPALLPGGQQLVAVNRGAEWSDLVLLSLDGKTSRAVTSDNRSPSSLNLNHWAFYPRPTSDGRLLYSYDSPKSGFEVDLAVWQLTLGRSQATAVRRTTPNGYTGGDVFPNPLKNGGLVYAKYKSDATSGMIVSQLWLQLGLESIGKELTPSEQDCGQPSVAPDESAVAMVCTSGKQAGQVMIASFDGDQLGPPVAVSPSGQVAVPSWSPDGRSLAYLAPASPQGHFQLWVVDLGTGRSHPGKPRRLTDNLDLDATSPPAWG